MPGKKHDSGAKGRKLKRIKGSRENELLKKIPKLTGFFRPELRVQQPGSSLSAITSDVEIQSGRSPSSERGECVERSGGGKVTLDERTSDAQAQHGGRSRSSEGDTGDDERSVIPEEKEAQAERGQGNDPCYSTDLGRWSNEINEEVRAYWARMGPESCQNKHGDFSASERQYKQQKRFLSKFHFKRKLANGEYVPREWLCYSPSLGKVFCFACKIFGDNVSKEKSSYCNAGYCDWKHAKKALSEHESSDMHRKAMITYINRRADRGTVDSELKKQFNDECAYWRKVLERIVAVVKYLAERGLAFRGESHRFGDNNNGNYLGSLELISQFDPFLKAHIEKYGHAGRGTPSYLSHSICEEFIELMGEKVVNEVISRVRMAKYFSISVDSSPDVTHVDQLTFILRYVSPEGFIEERFVKFLPITSHTGEALFNSVINTLQEMGIDIQNCRGQCYDNASNMAGAYKGLQSRIKETSPLAEWVPCAAHTLNLVGVNSVNCCEDTEQFFSFVQNLFNFSSRSTSRWNTIKAGLQPNENKRIETLKTLSDTRWSAHSVATKSLCQNYIGIQQSLQSIAEDEHQNMSTRVEARALSKNMDRLEIAFMCNMWNDILARFQRVSAALQAVELDLCNAVDLVRSLRDYVAGLRDQFDSFETAAKNMSPTVSDLYKADTQRAKKRKRQADESSEPECQLSGRRRFCVSVFTVVIDRLVAELDRRYQSYSNLCETFGFMNRFHSISPEDLRLAALGLQKKYHSDLEEDFVEEPLHFREFVHNEKTNKSAVDLLKLLRKRELHTVFPNMYIAFRLYLTLPVTNASGERSFSKLSLVKSRLRSSMQQGRVNNLTLMSIEHDILHSLDFSGIIKTFATKKSRQRHF